MRSGTRSSRRRRTSPTSTPAATTRRSGPACARATSRPRTGSRRSAHRPAFAWVTATPHGNEPAAGEASMRLLYEMAARLDCSNARRLQNLTTFIVPATNPDGRDLNTAHDGVGLRSQPRPRHAREHRERRLHRGDRQVPGRVRHRRPPAGQRVLLPAQRGRRPPRGLAVRDRLHPERHRPDAAADVQRPERRLPELQRLRPVRADLRRQRPGAAGRRRRHDLREGLERGLRQAGLRPLPGDGRDARTSRPTRRSRSSTGGCGSGARRASRAPSASCR